VSKSYCRGKQFTQPSFDNMTLDSQPSGASETLAQPPAASLNQREASTTLPPEKLRLSSQVGNAEASTFQLRQQWHSQPRKMRIIHVGAGATGLCAAYKFERQLANYELVCYEKNDEVGGTWLQNRYPGCACDVPAHIYTYTFEPNPFWKSYYAYSPEIQDYFVNFCEKYQLRKYIKVKHRVLSATWHEEKGQWAVEVEHDGQIFTDWCHVLVNGSGLLNKYRCKLASPLDPVSTALSNYPGPDIEGLHSFKGSLIHSADWDRKCPPPE
jgi:hypothetical protein